jgi:hypothetical protein
MAPGFQIHRSGVGLHLSTSHIYAHLPNALIKTILITNETPPVIVTNVLEWVISSPRTQSQAHISTSPIHTRIPGDKASSVPRAIRVDGSFPLKDFNTPIPTACRWEWLPRMQQPWKFSLALIAAWYSQRQKLLLSKCPEACLDCLMFYHGKQKG